MATDNMIFELVKNTNDRMLDLVKDISTIKESNSNTQAKVGVLSDSYIKIVDEQKKIVNILQSKMTPDRCALFHNDLKKQIFSEMKDGARGWMKTAMTVLKAAAWASVTFGGSALGAQALGLFR